MAGKHEQRGGRIYTGESRPGAYIAPVRTADDVIRDRQAEVATRLEAARKKQEQLSGELVSQLGVGKLRYQAQLDLIEEAKRIDNPVVFMRSMEIAEKSEHNGWDLHDTAVKMHKIGAIENPDSAEGLIQTSIFLRGYLYDQETWSQKVQQWQDVLKEGK